MLLLFLNNTELLAILLMLNAVVCVVLSGNTNCPDVLTLIAVDPPRKLTPVVSTNTELEP